LRQENESLAATTTTSTFVFFFWMFAPIYLLPTYIFWILLRDWLTHKYNLIVKNSSTILELICFIKFLWYYLY
jgi:ABC-type bacteriocin/lantibiotic exporter with double-glycine peptidase domain